MLQLLQIKRISDNIDVKKIAKAWAPSLIAINEIHRQDVISRFNADTAEIVDPARARRRKDSEGSWKELSS